MKTKNLFLLGFVALALSLGFTSCDKEKDPDTGKEKGAATYVSVSLKMSGSRANAPQNALPNDYNYLGEWAGKDKINNIAIYILNGAEIALHQFDVNNGGADDYLAAPDGNGIKLTPQKAIRTTAGSKKFYVLINGTAEVIGHLATLTAGDFENKFAEVALELANSAPAAGEAPAAVVSSSAEKLAVKNGVANEAIVMTSVVAVTENLLPNIKEDDALAGLNNKVTVNVQRAVGRVMITTNALTYEVRNSLNVKVGDISNITYAIAQGENKLYLQQKATYATPSFGFVPATDAAYWAGAGDNYDYSDLYQSTTVPELAAYSGALGEVTTELDAQLSGKFILPNTHQYGATPAASQYKKGNTAYVLVRATFTPTTFADGGVYVPGSDFYLGENGQFYVDEDNTQDPTKGGEVGQKISRYKDAKVLYYAWVNPDQVPNFINSPVLRNHIYHIHITGFKTIGTNWNPLFPEDPDNPKGPPVDPADPTGPKTPLNPDPLPPVDPSIPTIDPPVDPEDPLKDDTWMSVDINVLPWYVHSYSIDLGF